MKTFEYDILSFPMTRKTSLADMQASLNERARKGGRWCRSALGIREYRAHRLPEARNDTRWSHGMRRRGASPWPRWP